MQQKRSIATAVKWDTSECCASPRVRKRPIFSCMYRTLFFRRFFSPTGLKRPRSMPTRGVRSRRFFTGGQKSYAAGKKCTFLPVGEIQLWNIFIPGKVTGIKKWVYVFKERQAHFHAPRANFCPRFLRASQITLCDNHALSSLAA